MLITLPMHTEGTPHSFFVGQPPVGCTIENVSGQMSPGGTGTFQIYMENIETVNVLEFTILDMPDYMTVTDIQLLDRFEDGTIDGNSGETVDGSFYFSRIRFCNIYRAWFRPYSWKLRFSLITH